MWWWVLYIIDCDMNVIVFFAFGKFVSVSFRSWAWLSGETPQHWVSELRFKRPPPLAAFAFSEPAPVGVQAALGWKRVTTRT